MKSADGYAADIIILGVLTRKVNETEIVKLLLVLDLMSFVTIKLVWQQP